MGRSYSSGLMFPLGAAMSVAGLVAVVAYGFGNAELPVNSSKHIRKFIEGEVVGEKKEGQNYELKVRYDENGVDRLITFSPTNGFEIDYLDTFFNQGDKVRIQREGIVSSYDRCGCEPRYSFKEASSIEFIP